MAIVVEQEKKGGSALAFLSWIILIVLIGFAAFYIFFKNPELVDYTGSSDTENVLNLSSIKIDPDQVLENSKFKELKTYVNPAGQTEIGRPNPFLPL
jgi:hypothetical protein